MSERPGVFDFVFLPGIVAGMMLAGVVLAVSDVSFPDAFHSLFPKNTPLLALGIAIAVASTIGLLSLAWPSRPHEQNHQDAAPSKDLKEKKNFTPGGTDAF
jgi:hypothetical protein